MKYKYTFLLVLWPTFFIFAQRVTQHKKFLLDNTDKNYLIEIYSFQKSGIYHLPVYNTRNDSLIRIFQKSIFLDLKTKKNVSIIVKDKSVESIKILLQKVDTLKINDALDAKVFIQCPSKLVLSGNIGTLKINKSTINKLNLPKASLNSVILKECNISYMNFNSSIITNTFKLSQVILDTVFFNNAQLPKLITIDTVSVINSTKIVDLSMLKHINNNSIYGYGLERTLRISDTDIDNFKIPYDRFNFHVDTLQGIAKRTWIYEKILRNLSNLGLTEKYEYYKDQHTDAKDTINHGWIRNTINNLWWDNGYNRRKVFYNSFGIFIIFFIVNFTITYFSYSKLKLVYMPETFKDYFHRIEYRYLGDHIKPNKFKYRSLQILGVFIFTSFIFWGLRLEMNSLKVKFIPLLLFIICQYMVGLICVAYIIGIIIVK